MTFSPGITEPGGDPINQRARQHVLDAVGNASLMTTELKVTIAEHSAGNYRVMMNIAEELLVAAAERELPRLDEKLYFDVFQQAPVPKPRGASKRKEARA